MSKITPALYSLPGAKGDLSKTFFIAFWIWVCCGLLAMIAATQYAAAKFGYSAALGSPLVPSAGKPGGLYLPTDIFVWIFRYWRPDVATGVRTILGHAIMILLGGGAAGLLAALGFVLHRSRKLASGANHLHGSAGWADLADIQKTGLLPGPKNAGGVMLGQVEVPHRAPIFPSVRLLCWLRWTTMRKVYLRHKGPEHILVFAPTRSGKGVGIVVPTLLSWDESVLVHDVKGENWALTSGFRQKVQGQRCLRFSPSEPGSAKFNPLKEIRMDGNIVKDVQNIATIIVDPDGKGLSDHWAKTGFDLLTGVILFVLLEDRIKPGERSLATVQAILSDGGVIREMAEETAQKRAGGDGEASTGIKAVFEYIRDRGHEMPAIKGATMQPYERIGWQTATQAASSYLNKAPNEASGVLSTSLSFLSLYRDPIVAENTSSSDFDIESLMMEKTALYLVVPPSDKDRLKPLLRLILNQVVRRLTEQMEFEKTGASKTKFNHRLLLLIDEFPALGRLDVFEEALAFIAGYGLKALLITQDLSQLQKAYTRDESIISNCHIRIAYAPNKVETAEILSKMAGQSTVVSEQRNYSGSRLSVLLNNVSTSEQVTQRPLLTADECMRLPPDDELVFVAGFRPIYGQKIKYYSDPALSRRQQIGPAVPVGGRLLKDIWRGPPH